ncbi:prefoldin subunit [Necator americanus]|uniref:Prefoldin subunit 3 n=1 Tax=Necator americanus TaxID=51031 RepID=W2TZJ6_NECAM|nr:prefoldin subunit [Necator americanus]ETN86491.1 prefoldin subunit [Necator americanus]
MKKLSPEEGVAALEERYKKYKYVEASMTSQKTRMAEKLPDFKNSLALLDVLIDKKFRKKFIRKPQCATPKRLVSIWLGANVMVEYELEKAKELLEKNQGNVQKEKAEPFETTYLVSEEVYTKATVRNPEKVSIWLGANVMVEYELEKAKELLEKNQGNVQKAVDELTSELMFVKDQITTTEVNIAHVHNYGVKKRQQKAAA